MTGSLAIDAPILRARWLAADHFQDKAGGQILTTLKETIIGLLARN